MTLIPEGKWRGRAESYEFGWSSNNNEQIGVQIILSPNQDEEVDGRTIVWYGTFSEKAEPYTMKALRALGWQGDDISDLSDLGSVEADIVIEHEADYVDPSKTRARVRFINALGSGAVAMKNKMLPHQVAELAARMRGRAMASAKAAAPAPTPAATPPTAAAKRARAAVSAAQAAASDALKDDSDIPF